MDSPRNRNELWPIKCNSNAKCNCNCWVWLIIVGFVNNMKKMHSLLTLHHFMLIPTSKDVKTRITTDGGNLDQRRNWVFIMNNYNRKQNWRYVWRRLISRNKDITTQWCIFKKRHLLNVIKYSLYMNTFELYYKSPGSIFKSQTHMSQTKLIQQEEENFFIPYEHSNVRLAAHPLITSHCDFLRYCIS